MFLYKYLDNFYYNLVIEEYEESYLNTLNEKNFIEVYNVFKKYNFYFINDIILKYLELFELPSSIIENNILKLKEKLGNNYIYIIGNNLTYLEELDEDY